MKTCTRCGHEQPNREFHWRRTGNCRYRHSQCRKCIAERANLWAKEHPERRNAIVRKYNQTNSKRRRWKRRYYQANKTRYAEQHARHRANRPDLNLAQIKRWQAGARRNLKPWYAKRLLKRAGKPITKNSIAAQQDQTRIWRTQPLLKSLAVAGLLSSK